jgi:hypothetical protein
MVELFLGELGQVPLDACCGLAEKFSFWEVASRKTGAMSSSHTTCPVAMSAMKAEFGETYSFE